MRQLQVYFLHTNHIHFTYNFPWFPGGFSPMCREQSFLQDWWPSRFVYLVDHSRTKTPLAGLLSGPLQPQDRTFLYRCQRPEGDGCLLQCMSQEHNFISKQPTCWPWERNVSFLQSEGFRKGKRVMLVVLQFKFQTETFIPHNSHTFLDVDDRW